MTVTDAIKNIWNFLTNRNTHKLAGLAVAIQGLADGEWKHYTLGAAYAALMHVAGGIKGVPDSTVTTKPTVVATPTPAKPAPISQDM